jgi:L-alanine-DL-glutamate epimerase-like enolase superfamily enzyme
MSILSCDPMFDHLAGDISIQEMTIPDRRLRSCYNESLEKLINCKETAMRIVDIRLEQFQIRSWTGKDAFGHDHPCKERTAVVSRLNIYTDSGLVGQSVTQEICPVPTKQYDPDMLHESYSSAGSDAILIAMINRITPMLIGEDPFCREKIFDSLCKIQRLVPLTDEVIALVDLCLWDIAGKFAGLPVYKLLGGHRTRLLAYASIMVGDSFPGGLATPEDYGRFAGHLIRRGYRSIKLHAWMDERPDSSEIAGKPDIMKNVAACRAVREAAGDTMPLMHDAYHHYDRSEALLLGRELEKLNFTWFEEPMDEYNSSSYRWLADQLDIPVIGPETARGRGQTRAEWIMSGACDICRAGIKSAGGITSLMKIVHLCELHGVPLELHSPGRGTMHVMAAMMISGKYYERGLLHPFLNYDATPPWFNAPADIMDHEGYVLVPDQPGLGYDFNDDYIRNHLVR